VTAAWSSATRTSTLDETRARAEQLDRRARARSGRPLGPIRSGLDEIAAGQSWIFVSTGSAFDDPRPLLHAMSRGAAILAPAVCGMGERVAFGVNGWSYQSGDTRALAARLEALVRDHETRIALASRSVSRFGCLWSFQEMASRAADLVWGAWHLGASHQPGGRW
jgi:glycosyltransferase involved in cell wall biosynthesis